MAAQYDSEFYQAVVSSFMKAARKIPSRYAIQQPVNQEPAPADATENIQALSRHMCLGESDTQWLMYLATQLHAKVGPSMLAHFWILKQDIVSAEERHRRPREPSPFTLPPAAAQMVEADSQTCRSSTSRKRSRSTSP